MKYRKFGSLDWNVSEVGLGCWQIGADWGNVTEDSAQEILKSSYENGVNFFDTADVYGMGRSEKFVGDFLKSVSDRIYVATKAGRQINPHVAEGYYDKALMESYVDQSLLNLNVETIDLLQMHCPPTEVYSSDNTFEMLDYLVSKGKIQNYGFSVQTVDEALECIKRPNTKSIQVIFNIFRQKPAEKLFKIAKEKKVAKYVMENIQRDYVNCYSFYKVAAQSFKDAGKDKNIIDSLENSADVSLKYNYDLGEIMGLNPEVMSQMTKDKVNKFVELAKKDFASLAKEYGMMCKSLVENPEQRTNFWEAKGNKKFK